MKGLLIFIFLLTSSAAHGAAWMRKPQNGIAYLSYSYQKSSNVIEAGRILIPLHYRKREQQLYMEYGLSEKIGLVFKGYYGHSEYAGGVFQTRRSNKELSLRFAVPKFKNKKKKNKPANSWRKEIKSYGLASSIEIGLIEEEPFASTAGAGMRFAYALGESFAYRGLNYFIETQAEIRLWKHKDPQEYRLLHAIGVSYKDMEFLYERGEIWREANGFAQKEYFWNCGITGKFIKGTYLQFAYGHYRPARYFGVIESARLQWIIPFTH